MTAGGDLFFNSWLYEIGLNYPAQPWICLRTADVLLLASYGSEHILFCLWVQSML